jgi:hypothetical protein
MSFLPNYCARTLARTLAATLAATLARTFAATLARTRADTGALTLGFSGVDAVELATMALFVVFRLFSRDFF